MAGVPGVNGEKPAVKTNGGAPFAPLLVRVSEVEGVCHLVDDFAAHRGTHVLVVGGEYDATRCKRNENAPLPTFPGYHLLLRQKSEDKFHTGSENALPLQWRRIVEGRRCKRAT